MRTEITRTLVGVAIAIALLSAPAIADADPLSIAIDIQPQTCPNVISVSLALAIPEPQLATAGPSKASVPVAILGSPDCPVSEIDRASIRFEGVAPLNTKIADVSGPPETAEVECECPAKNGDGYPDLIACFDRDALVIALGLTSGSEQRQLTLTCALKKGTAASGEDCVTLRTYLPGKESTPAAPTTKDATSARNFPNPFNAATVIGYTLTESGPVRLDVYDVLGRKVMTLVNEFQTAGTHEVSWDATDSRGANVASGMYFYRLTATGASETKKMVLLR